MPSGHTRDETVRDLFLLDQTAEGEPTAEGQVRRVGNDIRAYVGGAAVSLISGTGLSEGSHEALDTLVHELAESGDYAYTYADGRVSNVTFKDPTTKDVRSWDWTYAAGRVFTVVEKQYDSSGTLKTTITYTYSYSAGRVSGVNTVRVDA